MFFLGNYCRRKDKFISPPGNGVRWKLGWKRTLEADYSLCLVGAFRNRVGIVADVVLGIVGKSGNARSLDGDTGGALVNDK